MDRIRQSIKRRRMEFRSNCRMFDKAKPVEPNMSVPACLSPFLLQLVRDK